MNQKLPKGAICFWGIFVNSMLENEIHSLL